MTAPPFRVTQRTPHRASGETPDAESVTHKVSRIPERGSRRSRIADARVCGLLTLFCTFLSLPDSLGRPMAAPALRFSVGLGALLVLALHVIPRPVLSAVTLLSTTGLVAQAVHEHAWVAQAGPVLFVLGVPTWAPSGPGPRRGRTSAGPSAATPPS